ncbi:NnrS family protein [Tistrella sp. BH-R2-4]|uniref:NnrS family protein n=1 Tax=Tistrella arctica TaxID=3133430 RepID=A0ABU9YKR8_9PROT
MTRASPPKPAGSAAIRRAYTGPAILHGFRLFFMAAAIWAVIAMVAWIPLFRGMLALPTGLGLIDWHAHEMIYGYVPAVVAGFLLTAVPNWTGRLPILGRPVLLLGLLWLAGRLAVALSGVAGAQAAALVDLAFPVVLALAIGREIIAARNSRNMKVLLILALLIAGNALFHGALLWPGAAADAGIDTGTGLRLGLAVTLLLIMLVGGRIVPSFTRNWLAKRGPGPLPVAFDRLDGVCMAVAAVALAAWVWRPDASATAALAALAAIAHAVRLARWTGWRSGAEPLVLVLHLAYGFVPLGFACLGLAILRPDILQASAALHAWTAGAIGLMTMAVMSRASLGHAGLPLHAGPAVVLVYALLILSAVLRILSGSTIAGDAMLPLIEAAAAAWIAGFTLFVAAYWSILTRYPAR